MDSLSNKIHQLVYEKLNSLKPGARPQSHEWTVVSSMILQECDQFSVIVLSTGTKCLGRNDLSCEGLVVNDCHAEVLCRRGFVKYLIEELAKCKNQQRSVFTYNDQLKKYLIKDGIQFHLYISQSPCGYGSVYKQENGKRQAVEIANAKQRQSKRQKVVDDPFMDDGLEDMHLSGAKFLSNDAIRLSTKPGRGDPSRSYSCSDKLCLWNYLGYQGACLSKYITPVFVSTVVIGNQWDDECMKKALFSRTPSCSVLDSCKLLHDVEECPYCETAVLRNLTDGQKLSSSGSSLVWIAPKYMEMLIPNKGIRLGTNYKKGITIKNSSALCPKRLFQLFCNVFKVEGTYEELKESAEEYQKKKHQLEYGFMKEWKRKDRMYYKFSI